MSSVNSVQTSTRVLWIDFLRGLAVLGMIEAHSVNSFLAPIYRVGFGFEIISYINGWVAPTFLFIAGLLQGAWVRKNWDTPKPLASKLRSLAVILLIGYALQFPWDSVLDGQKVLLALGKVDVLHCIALSLAALLLLSRVFKKVISYDLLVLFLAIALVIASPFVWKYMAAITEVNPLVGYVSPHRGALFPLFPWSAFLFAGTLASRWLCDNPKSKESAQTFAILFVLTAAFGWILRAWLGDWFGAQTYATRYDFFCFRLSLVFLGCSLCALLVSNQQPGRVTLAINWCGSRSLSLYVWHLVILHSGLGLVPALRSIFPKIQTPSTVVWLYLLTLGGTLLLTWFWQKLLVIFVQRRERACS